MNYPIQILGLQLKYLQLMMKYQEGEELKESEKRLNETSEAFMILRRHQQNCKNGCPNDQGQVCLKCHQKANNQKPNT